MIFGILHEYFNFPYKEIAAYFNKKNISLLSSKSKTIIDRDRMLFETLCQKLYNNQ